MEAGADSTSARTARGNAEEDFLRGRSVTFAANGDHKFALELATGQPRR